MGLKISVDDDELCGGGLLLLVEACRGAEDLLHFAEICCVRGFVSCARICCSLAEDWA